MLWNTLLHCHSAGHGTLFSQKCSGGTWSAFKAIKRHNLDLIRQHLSRSRLTNKTEWKTDNPKAGNTKTIPVNNGVTDHYSVMRLFCTSLEPCWFLTNPTYPTQTQQCSRGVTVLWGELYSQPKFHWISQDVSSLDPTFPKEKQRHRHFKEIIFKKKI